MIAFNPLEEEKRVQTDVLFFTVCKGQPGCEARSFVYFFAGEYELKSILPLVEGNARRKAVELLHEYIERRHSHFAAALPSLRFVEASEEFPAWYSTALLACPWNLRESFYDLRERVHSEHLIALLDQAFDRPLSAELSRAPSLSWRVPAPTDRGSSFGFLKEHTCVPPVRNVR